MEPWSIVAVHPYNNEPFGLVIEDDSDLSEAHYIATQLLSTFLLTGAYLPDNHNDHTTQGFYLFTYTIAPETIPRLATIWAECCADAELRLNVLASDGTLLMQAQ